MYVALYASLILFAIAIALWLRYQREVIRYELAPEAESGLIAKEEAALIPRYWAREKAYWRLLSDGRPEEWRISRRLHNELVDLAFAKWRLRHAGGDPALVDRRRKRIEYLKGQREAAARLLQP
jgi:hypothetical protein